MYTTYSWEKLNELLKGDPNKPILSQKILDKTEILNLHQFNSVLEKVLNDEELVQNILYATRFGEEERQGGAIEMSEKTIELVGSYSSRIFNYTDVDNKYLYRIFQQQINRLIRDYIVHRYINHR